MCITNFDHLLSNSNYYTVTASDYGEGNSRSEWLFYRFDEETPVSEIQEGVLYKLQNRSAATYSYTYKRFAVISNNQFCIHYYGDHYGTDNNYRAGVEFKKLSDGSYYVAFDGNLIQQETTTNKPLSFYTATAANDDWEYTMCSTPYYPETLAAKMTSYKATATDVTMPEEVKFEGKQYKVFGIGRYLGNRGNITSLTLPATFRYFDNYALSNADNLRKVVIPEGVTSIPNYAFYSCDNLDNIVLPSTVKSICSYAFSDCRGLTNITLSKDLTTISADAFSGCSALASYAIPAENTTYATTGDGVLYRKDMTDIVLFPQGKTGSYSIPSTMTAVRDNLFQNAAKLEQVVIPSSITSIGAYAFYGCNALTEVTIPKTVTTIGEWAFYGNLLSKINMVGETPATLAAANSFYGDAFFFVPDDHVDDYKSALIWNDMEDRIFATNMAFTEVTNTAEDGRINLAENVGVGNEQKVVGLKVHGTINGWDIMVMNTKMKNLRYLDLSDAEIVHDEGYAYYPGYTAQDNVLGAYSFYQLTNLRTIALPKNITSIGSYALANCTKLTSVTGMPETCTTIGNYAFSGDGNLKEVTIGTGVETINSSAFRYCSGLPEITIPASVKSINYGAFQNCSGLKEVHFAEGLTSIGNEAFSGCSSIKELKLPNSLSSIGSYAFQSCSKIENITFPKDLKEINSYAFSGCRSLTELKLPSNLERIYNYAFNGCTSLSEIHIPSMLQSIGDYAFTGCGAKDVYAYTLNPVPVTMNTFDYSKAVLHAPNNPYSVFLSYYADNGWRKFLNVLPFDAEYDRWYLGDNQDVALEDGETIPNEDGTQAEGDLNPGSGLEYKPGSFQWLDKLNLKWKGGKFPSLIDNSSVFVDELTFILEVQAGKWYFFCFPFDIDLSDARQKFNGKFVWRRYDGGERANGKVGWVNVDNQRLKAFEGYIFQTNKSGEIELTIADPTFTGADQDVTIEAHPSDNAQDASWNFVGNPFLCYFNVGNLAESYKAPITVWNPSTNNYEAISPEDDDYVFHPFEAFFVQKPNDESAVSFDAEGRETSNQSVKTQQARRRARAMKGIDESRLIVNIAVGNDDDFCDKTRVVFNDDRQLGYEQACDAAKFESDDAAIQLYTLDSKQVKYAINERPNGDRTVKLGYIAGQEGVFYINAQRMDCAMMLQDKVTGTLFDLCEGEYEFRTEAGQFDDRFLLVANPNALKGVQEGAFATEAVEGGIVLNGLNGETANIYSVNGMLVSSTSDNGVVEVPAGAYIVKLGEKTRKVVVK